MLLLTLSGIAADTCIAPLAKFLISKNRDAREATGTIPPILMKTQNEYWLSWMIVGTGELCAVFFLFLFSFSSVFFCPCLAPSSCLAIFLLFLSFSFLFLLFSFCFAFFSFLFFPLSSVLCFFSPIDLRLSCVCVVIDTTCDI